MPSPINGETVDGLLGRLVGADMNLTADQAIPLTLLGGSKYIVEKIVVTNASTSLTLAAGGIYDTAAKGGNAIVAAVQVYSALSAAGKVVALTLAALTDVLTAPSLFLSLTTGQGVAATADIYVFGRVLP